MRTVLLTTVAAAALAGFSFQAAAQNNIPRNKTQTPAAESNEAPAAQQKNMPPERAGRSAAEPSESEKGGTAGESGAATKGTGQQGGAKHERKHGAAAGTQEMKQERGPAENQTQAKPGEKRKGAQTQQEQTHPSTQAPAAHPKAKEGNAPGTATGGGQKGAATQRTEHPSTGRSAAPEANAPSGNAAEKGPNAATGMQQQTPKGPNAAKGMQQQTPGNEAVPGGGAGRNAAGQNAGQTPGKTVTLNSQQETEVRTALVNEPAENVGRVDFAITAGTIVPSHVSIRPLPERIVDIVPQYRGYDYAVVQQDVIIIEPQTRRIVTVLHREGRSAVNAPRGRLHLTGEQRKLVRRDLRSGGSPASMEEVRLGERVPENITIMDVPSDIIAEVPELRQYDYFVTDEDVVLVEPDTREIVEIIR